MKVLIKLGGTLLDDAFKRRDMARQLSTVAKQFELVVVHGGGKQVTRFLEERGVQSRFSGGLRVSDETVIDAVSKVIAGSVNKQLVSAMTAAGQLAVGLSGVDGLLTSAEPLDLERLGFVGKPTGTDGKLFQLLGDSGYVPVVACIAGDRNGNIYNVNADQMAVSCALGWSADKLLFLTDVPGVKGQDGAVVAHLTPPGVLELVASGVAHGGMQAKLEAAVWSLESGLSEVVIASGQEPEICGRLLRGESLGTRLTVSAGKGEAA
ncbi:MAG TPA: acetylglutamate kinase [Bryobacteraceae bacterium]|nr:acetylglutamate kinase [Bryobacteraceae bacterium]